MVLGQTVQTTATTVFDDSLAGGLAALTAGTVVEVHALFDAASGRYIATRIEDEDNTSFYKLRGVIANLDTTAKTFTIGSEVINYAGLTVAELPACWPTVSACACGCRPRKWLASGWPWRCARACARSKTARTPTCAAPSPR